MSQPKPPAARPSRNDAQRQIILDAASLLFIEKGFGGTHINDIADAVGLTRTALYYYFPSKESMLEALTEEITVKAGQLAASVATRDALAPPQALRQLILLHAGLVLSHPLQFRVVERSESSLPEAHRAAAESARRAVLDHFVRVIQRGIDGGQFRAGDAHVSAFSIIGMCNWCAWWFDVRGAVPAEAVAASIADFSARALAPDRQTRRTRPATPQGAIGQMREALAALESRFSKPA